MSPHIDLDGYLARIGHANAVAPTLQTLRELVRAHAQTIPFESLTPLSGNAVSLDLKALEKKLIRSRRGGYCFEQNLLLRDVLEQLGFKSTGLAARVLWNAPPSSLLPRTHMLLLVETDQGPHVVDVGFGGLTLTGALRLETNVEQPTPHEPFRLIESGGTFVLQAKVREEWRPLYSFDLQPQWPVDYEPVNWYLSTHADSRFVKNLIAARTTPDRRLALLNCEMAVHHLNGHTHRRTLQSVPELRAVLEQDFQIEVPEGQAVDAALERVVTGASRT